jgi:Leucine-rich repeat (LRR) protein
MELPDAAFAPLADCRNLQTLGVYSNPNFTGQALSYLDRCPITILKIERCGLTDDMLALMRHCPKVDELVLNGNVGVSHVGLAHLAGLGKLRKLSLSGTGVDPAQLGVLKDCRALRILTIDTMNVSSDAGVALSQLQSIERLEMRSAKILSSDIVMHLKKLPKLKELLIGNGPSLTDSDMASIGAFEKLEKLWLPSGIGDATLAEVAKLPNLNELYLNSSSNTLTDESLQLLQGMKKLKKLQLAAGFKRFTDAAIAAFKKARPDVTVTR